jgi:PKD repeat protein
VNTAPVASFTANCVLLVCSFDASSSSDNAGIVNYAWNFGGSIINRTTALISNTFLVTGTVSVSLTVRDAAGLTGTVTKSVSMSAGSTSTSTPSGGGAEPSGMTKLTETGFNCINGCGEWGAWDQQYSGAANMVVDPTAPKSGSNVVQMNYTPSLRAGWAPMSFAPKSGSLPQKQTLYVAIWLKLSNNYVGQVSGVNKVLHFFTPRSSGGNVAIFNIRGSGSGTLVPAFLLQGLATSPSAINLDAAASVCTTVRGKWTKYEMVLKNSTPGVSDGTATLWMDGKKCVERTGLAFVRAGDSNKWETIWWSPTWGGTGSNPTTSFSESVDHIYVSGK